MSSQKSIPKTVGAPIYDIQKYNDGEYRGYVSQFSQK